MSSAICPYCRTPVGPDSDPPQLFCHGCGTPHHAECFEENGGCTIFGCSAAPAEEPKLTIAAPDLAAPVIVARVSSPVAPNINPPPQPSAATSDELQSVRYSPMNTLFVGPDPAQQATFTPQVPAYPSDYAPSPNAKNRTTFILLGVLLGFFGAHSFYAGFRGRGFLQLAITVCTLGVAAVAIWMWAIIDICTISRDSMGVNFRN